MSVTVHSELGQRWSLRPGVYSAVDDRGDLMLAAWPHTERLGPADAGTRALLHALSGTPRPLADLPDCGTGDLLDRLAAGGWLATTVTCGDRELYTTIPVSAPSPRSEPVAEECTLSRFAVVRAVDGAMTIESPRSWCDIHVHDPAVLALLGDLNDRRGAAAAAGLGPEVLSRVRADLVHAGLAVPQSAEDSGSMSSRQWSPHELWFHERSRLGHRGALGVRFGGTFWARGEYPPPAARPGRYPGSVTALAKPDLLTLRRTDLPLTAVLEDRESVREYDDEQPITTEALGEFLYRCARVRLARMRDGFEHSNKPYPSGGSAYELEVYPVVRLANGLTPAMYHYDAHEHVLRQVRSGDHPAVRRMLRVAGQSAIGPAHPQVLLVISARVGRIMWKYEAMAYALLLKHVGVLQQTMYCVATSMGLAPCAIGSGDSAAFAEAAGRDPLDECAVGEFLLGSRRADPMPWELV